MFILQNAKRDPQSATEKAARYVVVPATEDLFLKQHLNHTVRILGVPDGRPQPTPQAGGAVDEKLVPALNAKGLTMVANACGTHGGGDRSRIGFGSSVAGFFGFGASTLGATAKPSTLLLIASGLLLVAYAGRRREWNRFGRRSAR